MPPLETTDLRQYAVLWAAAGQDVYGAPVVADGIEIKVRWLDKLSQAVDPTGNTIQTVAQVIASQLIPVQSILWLGRLCNIVGPPYPGLHIIVGDDNTPDIKNRNIRYEYKLMRYTQQLPQKTGTGT